MKSLLFAIFFALALIPAALKGQAVFVDGLQVGTGNNYITAVPSGGSGFGDGNTPFNLNSNVVVNGGLWVSQTSASTPAIQIRGGFRAAPRLQLYGLDASSEAWMGLGADMSISHYYEHSIYFPGGHATYLPGAPLIGGRLTIGDYDGTTYNTHMTILQNGNVGIGVMEPAVALDVSGGVNTTGDSQLGGNIILTKRQGDIWMGDFGNPQDAGPSN